MRVFLFLSRLGEETCLLSSGGSTRPCCLGLEVRNVERVRVIVQRETYRRPERRLYLVRRKKAVGF